MAKEDYFMSWLLLCDLQVSGSIYKAVLAHRHTDLFPYCLWLLSATMAVTYCDGEYRACKRQDIHYQAFPEIVCWSLLRDYGRHLECWMESFQCTQCMTYFGFIYTGIIYIIAFVLSSYLVNKNKVTWKKLISLKCLGPAKQSYIKAVYFFKEKNYKWEIYITFLSNDFKVSQRIPDS